MMTDRPKPILLPVSVPWQIEAGAPYLFLQTSRTGAPISATFTAYFRLDESASQADVRIVEQPAEFESRPLDEKATYRLVRVSFVEGQSGRTRPAVADHEVVREADYDWTAIASVPRPDEPGIQTVRRVRQLWLMTGLCPDPCMYEVRGSPWLSELGLSESDFHHYLLLGHDEYIEVIARGWSWEAGQAVS